MSTGTGERHTAEITAALKHFPLDNPTVVGRPLGFTNDNWLVADSAGNRCILRAYRRVRETERVLFQIRLQEYLLAQGYPTPAVVETRTGEPFTELDGTPWALFEYVDGVEYSFKSLAQAVEAGRRLAQFHAVAEHYDGPIAPVSPGEFEFSALLAPPSSPLAPGSILAEEHEERLRELFAGQSFEAEIASFSEWRQRVALSWPVNRIAALPRTTLHTDYHGRNMLFSGDEMVALFDFDFVTRGPRTFDLGRGLFNFGREYRGSLTIREEYCRAFLDGYQSLAPLSAEEIDALPFMAVLTWAPDATFYEARLPHEGPARIAERLQHDVEIMRAVDGEVRRLAPLFGWKTP